MRDQRLDRLAEVLVNYSTAVKPGDLCRIHGEAIGLPLMEAIYEKVLVAGGHPFVIIGSDAMEEAFYRCASAAQLGYTSPVSQFIIENIDVSFGLWAEENTKGMSRVDPAKQALVSQARQPISKRFMERAGTKELRWTGTLYPTPASAQDAEMSTAEYADFVFRAGLLHLPDPIGEWKKISERQQRLVDFLDGKKEVRVIGKNTDLRLGVAGRKWVNCAGHENFPDGEVFTGPVEDAVDGIIQYSFPAVHHGREVHDITLQFKAGKVVEARASKGEAFLLSMIEQDPGASILGEFAIGTNYGIQQYTRHTLFDEKIGGTCHAALGAAYPETGGNNVSGLHWDMVCDLRLPGCRIEVDGETLLEAGVFVDARFPRAGG
jgi:aminopeptidase